MINSTVHQAQDSAEVNAELAIIVSRKEAREKGVNKYFTGLECSRGHISQRYTVSAMCITCSLIHGRSEAKRKYKLKYRAANSEKLKLQSRILYSNHREKYNERSKEWIRNNRDKVNEYRRNRYKDDENVKASIAMRGMVKRILNLSGKEKSLSTKTYLGYTKSDLVKHMESLFLEGMNWCNYGEWHIDHVKPVVLMMREGETRPSIINALSNLQPLWAFDNQSKGSKYDI